MANQLGIVHPELVSRLQPNFYPTSATIRRKTRVSDGMGGQTETWADVATVRCRYAPGGGKAGEQITADRLENASQWTIAFAGAPDVRDADRVVIGSRTFEVNKAMSATVTQPLSVLCVEVV